MKQPEAKRLKFFWNVKLSRMKRSLGLSSIAMRTIDFESYLSTLSSFEFKKSYCRPDTMIDRVVRPIWKARKSLANLENSSLQRQLDDNTCRTLLTTPLTLSLPWAPTGLIIDSTQSNARRFHSSMGKPLGRKGFKTDSVQSSSNTCKNYLLKIYSQHSNFLNAS